MRHTMRRLFALLFGVLLLSSGAAVAGPLDPPALVVRGTAPAVATLRLTAPLRLDLLAATVTTAGRVGGVAIFRGRAFQGGVLTTPGLDRQPSTRAVLREPAAVPGPSTVTLPPGTYAVHLLGEGTVEARLPSDAKADLSLLAKGKSRQTLDLATAAHPTNQPTTSQRKTITVSARSWVVAFGLYRPHALSLNVRLTTCLAIAGRPCGKRDPQLTQRVDQDSGEVRVFFPAEPRSAGKRDVLVTIAADPGAGGDLGLAALTVTP